jgi:hypothetical protein
LGFFTVQGEQTSLHTDNFNARLSTGDTQKRYARTGYLGFLRQTQAITADGGMGDSGTAYRLQNSMTQFSWSVPSMRRR